MVKHAVAMMMVMAAVAASAPAAAQPHDDRTVFTFSAPFEVPGAVLPAGTYVFRLADATSGRKMVQVLSADGASQGLFFTYEARRPDPLNEADITFDEAPIGTPPAVRVWWSPGNTMGREFYYPAGSRASQMADAHVPTSGGRSFEPSAQ